MNNQKIYGVLKTQVEIDKGEFTSSKSQMSHYNLIAKNEDGSEYQVNIDIQSNPQTPNVHMYYVENYQNAIVNQFEGISNGYTELPPQPDTLALDYIRENLFDITELSQSQALSADQISTVLDTYLESHEYVIVFGTKYADESAPANHYGASRYRANNSLPSQGVDCVHFSKSNVFKLIQVETARCQIRWKWRDF
ncbi:MAG: DUF2278 family protein [Flavobacteriia bacterium]|nr:DUF2278 family protein [Flavobacteriia bacterium]